MSKCIIHIPNELKPEMASASQIRPLKMINAFRKIGYEVDVIIGTSAERKKKIRQIEDNIKNGQKYDFMYAESSTMPTLLTDPNHLPNHPFADYSFFGFLKKRGIKTGLFYRDMYWKFPAYKESVSGLKASFAIKMYKYDLKQYNNFLDKMYLPNERCFKHLDKEIKEGILDVLPPGCEINGMIAEKQPSGEDIIDLIYVGGLGGHYKIELLLKVVSGLRGFRLTLCCRENEWLEQKQKLGKYISDNINVVHKIGKELEELYKAADIGILFLEPDIYREMAMPYKTFEYMGHGLAVIASRGTAVGDFVEDNDFGWTIPYGEDSLKKLLAALLSDKTAIKEKTAISKEMAFHNRWEDRAIKVANDLLDQR